LIKCLFYNDFDFGIDSALYIGIIKITVHSAEVDEMNLTKVLKWKTTGNLIVKTASGKIVEFGYDNEENRKKAFAYKNNLNRQKLKDDAFSSCGLVKVKGNLGGTYYE
jgi:hypothetical protein